MNTPAIAALLGATIASAPALAQEASMTEVADGVYHYYNGGYSSMVVVGNDGVMLIDTAFTPRAEAMKAAIAEITDTPVTHVAYSHEHFDHVGGFEVFPDAQVICHASCDEIFALSPIFPTPDVDIEFDDSYTLDLGGKTVEFVHPAIGDGNGATIARVEGTGVVFSTDMYRDKGFVPGLFIEHANFVGSRKIMHTLLEWEPTYAINGHGEGNSLEALKENAELYDKLYDGVTAEFTQAMAEGGVPAAIGLLFTISDSFKLDEYSDWEGYEENFPAHVKRMALSLMHGG